MQREIDYVAWQNRATRFYLAARLVHRNGFLMPAAYSAAITIEMLLKATLIYWDCSFDPMAAGHGMAKLVRMVKNKAKNASAFGVPAYFYEDQRFLTVSRYPTLGKGVYFPETLVADLDKVFASLVLLVPAQSRSTELKRALSGKQRPALAAIRYQNAELKELRTYLGVSLKKSASQATSKQKIT